MKVSTIYKSVVFTHSDCVGCIGHFDGLHIGHQQLVRKTVELAREKNLPAVLITFDASPLEVVRGIKQPQIQTIEKRIEVAEELGIDEVILLHFTKEMAATEPLDFFNEILVPLQLKALVCGFDYSFGNMGKGKADTLKEYAEGLFDVYIIEEVLNDDKKISSTRIRQDITEGNMEKVTELLGRPFEIDGVIIHGLQIGHKMGFPTANLDYGNAQMSPKIGVYAGQVKVHNNHYPAMINVGYNPTFHDQYHLSIEAHIVNFNENIYDEKVTFTFEKYLRPEQKFSSMEQLVVQLNTDIENVKHFFGI